MRSSPALSCYTKITSLMTILPSSPTVNGFTANNLRGSVRYWNRPQARTAVRDGGWFDACPAACPTAFASLRFEAGPAAARRLARGPSSDGSIRDEPGVLPEGPLAAIRRMVRSRRAPRPARRLAGGASAEDRIKTMDRLTLRQLVRIETAYRLTLR